MSTAMIQPASDLIPVYVTGKGPSYDVNHINEKMSPTPRGFMISVDGVLDVIFASGKHRMYPSGTFNTKTVYPIQIQKLGGNNTACVYVLSDSDITFG